MEIKSKSREISCSPKLWLSTGSYLGESLLKPMAKNIDNYKVEDGDLAEGLFSEIGKKSKVVEDAVAAEIAEIFNSLRRRPRL